MIPPGPKCREILLAVDPADIPPMRDEDDDNLLGTVMLFGVGHHLTLIRVVYGERGVEAANPADAEQLDDALRLYDEEYATVEVPGRSGRYVAIMHPYGR